MTCKTRLSLLTIVFRYLNTVLSVSSFAHSNYFYNYPCPSHVLYCSTVAILSKTRVWGAIGHCLVYLPMSWWKVVCGRTFYINPKMCLFFECKIEVKWVIRWFMIDQLKLGIRYDLVILRMCEYVFVLFSVFSAEVFMGLIGLRRLFR